MVRWTFMGLFVGFFMASQMAFASELSVERQSVLVKQTKSFAKKCLKRHKIKSVRAISVKNKTAEYLDKESMSDLFKEQLALTIDENSPYEIQANLSSSVKEKNKVRASHYEIQMSVSKSEGDAMCAQTYSKQFTETL